MRFLLIVTLVAGCLIAIWAFVVRRVDREAALDDLRSAISTSMLPVNVKAEMFADLNRGVTRPSQIEIPTQTNQSQSGGG